MIYLVIAVAVGLHVLALKWTHVVDGALQIISISRTSIATLRDPSLSDDQKGRSARASSLRLFATTAVLLARFAFAIAIPAAFFILMVEVRLIELPVLLSLLESPSVIIVATLAIITSLFWRPLTAKWRK